MSSTDVTDPKSGCSNRLRGACTVHVVEGRNRVRAELSAREIEILRRVAEGFANKRIAAELSISFETVKAHMKSILAKLRAADRTHAVTIALRRGAFNL